MILNDDWWYWFMIDDTDLWYWLMMIVVVIANVAIKTLTKIRRIQSRTYQINDYILPKFISVLRSDLTNVHHSFRIISIYVKYWSLHNLTRNGDENTRKYTNKKLIHKNSNMYKLTCIFIGLEVKACHSSGESFIILIFHQRTFSCSIFDPKLKDAYKKESS